MFEMEGKRKQSVCVREIDREKRCSSKKKYCMQREKIKNISAHNPEYVPALRHMAVMEIIPSSEPAHSSTLWPEAGGQLQATRENSE